MPIRGHDGHQGFSLLPPAGVFLNRVTPTLESFHGTFRSDGLDRRIFENGHEAKIVIEPWRRECNQRRPFAPLAQRVPGKDRDYEPLAAGTTTRIAWGMTRTVTSSMS